MKITNNTIKFQAKKISSKRAETMDRKLSQANGVDIICPESTNKDSANSALVMAQYLNQKGIESRIILSKDLEALNIDDNNQNIVQARDFIPLNSDRTILCTDFSSYDSVNPKLSNYIKDNQNVVCFDYHTNSNIKKENNLTYVDDSAKSTASIVYRYFEALNKKLNNETSFKLFSGLVSNLAQKSYVTCYGEKGKIKEHSQLKNNSDTYEIYNELKNNLTKEQVSTVAKQIDIISNLNKEEKSFKNSLYDKLEFSNNGKVAYIEISPDDKTWNKINQNKQTSNAILNRFRQEILNADDIVETVFTFYPSDDAYRFSAHSKNKDLTNFIDYIAKSNKIAGEFKGHTSHHRGKIFSLDKDTCHAWVQDIINSSDFYE